MLAWLQNTVFTNGTFLRAERRPCEEHEGRTPSASSLACLWLSWCLSLLFVDAHTLFLYQIICACPTDAPEGGGKSPGSTAPINDELDIFGPMVSNPLPSANNTQQAQVTRKHTHTQPFIICLSPEAGGNTGSLQRVPWWKCTYTCTDTHTDSSIFTHTHHLSICTGGSYQSRLS